jgi:hypothetical protein
MDWLELGEGASEIHIVDDEGVKGTPPIIVDVGVKGIPDTFISNLILMVGRS